MRLISHSFTLTDLQTILRHTLATIAYRLTKTVREVDAGFYTFESPNGIRKPIEIMYHMTQVLSFCLAAIEGKAPEKPVTVKEGEELPRFFKLLQQTDESLKENPVTLKLALTLVQGPLADLLTHVGQMALIRRYYNKPVSAENYMAAKIKIGALDPEAQDFS